MKRIIFVDDEPHVLEGLRGLLRKQRKEWEMSFVTSGEQALVALRAASHDVIVSDMRMPIMDGAALLRKVQEQYPQVVRIVLSGQTDGEVSRRMVHVAHQFISKPCDSRLLQQTIDAACNLQVLLNDPGLRRAVGQIGQLPMKPNVFSKLVTVLSHPASSIGDAADIVERDIGTASKILQVVNSAFFGLPNRVGDIRAAVSYLGLDTVKTLALSVEMRAAQAGMRPHPGFSMDIMQEHGFLTARIARRLLPEAQRGQDAFSAAMLQDAGLLVLMSSLPEVFAELLATARASGRALRDVEREVLGTTHAEIGAYLLGIWGLPYSIVEAVALHHTPRRGVSSELDVVGAVHVAGVLAQELAPFAPQSHLEIGNQLDEAYLEQLGLTAQLPAWRALARAELGGMGTAATV
jgi:HD-like signal output (HDOD) protein/CheY-like chemotaxis protein